MKKLDWMAHVGPLAKAAQCRIQLNWAQSDNHPANKYHFQTSTHDIRNVTEKFMTYIIRIWSKMFRNFFEFFYDFFSDFFENFSYVSFFELLSNFFSRNRSRRDDSFGPKIVGFRAILAIFRPFEDRNQTE